MPRPDQEPGSGATAGSDCRQGALAPTATTKMPSSGRVHDRAGGRVIPAPGDRHRAVDALASP